MPHEVSGIQPKDIDLRVKEKEPGTDHNLYLARFFSPDDNNPAFECVGIAFELEQLEVVEFTIGEKKIKLIDLMTSKNLVTKIDGVPHLAVSGFNVDIKQRGNVNVQNPITTNGLSADGGIARSYLYKDGIGVKGAGLVEYDDFGKQLGFGVGRPIQRTAAPNSSRLIPSYNAGGELPFHYANLEKQFSQTYWQLSSLSEDTPSFARVYRVFPYHVIPTMNSNGRYETSPYNSHLGLMIREDGKRGVPRKKLLAAIFHVLPYCLIDGNLPSPSFETDGHNAFIRNGKVIFTDYEAAGGIYPNLESYFNNLFNRWYMDELRKDFPEFCKMYNLEARGNLSNIDWLILDQTLRRNAGYGPYSLERYEKMDRRELIKLAMLYVMSQYASKISELEDGFLSLFSSNLFYGDNSQENLTVKDIYLKFKELVESGRLSTLYAFSIGDMKFTVEGDDVFYEMTLDTCGLPFNPIVRHKITMNNFIASFSEDAVAKFATGILSENPYSLCDESRFKKSIYSTLCTAFFSMKGSTFYHNRTHHSLNNLDVVSAIPTSLTFICSSLGITILMDHITGEVNISLDRDISSIPIESLNRLAYSIHVAIMSVDGNDLKMAQNIDIEV